MPDKATFHAAFEGAAVTATIDYARFKQGAQVADIIQTQWEGQPTPKIFPQYKAWMHTVMSQVAKRVNQQVFYTYLPAQGDRLQHFLYRPDGTYEPCQPPR
jgi:hypothetical protein